MIDNVDSASVKTTEQNEHISIPEYIERMRKESKGGKCKHQSMNQNESNILFVGEENAGKTSLINLCLGSKGKHIYFNRFPMKLYCK